MSQNLYETLGVKPDATPDQLKAARRKHARALHPDRDNGDAKKMADVNAAYEVLSDPERRAQYDASGRTCVPEKAVPNHIRLLRRAIDEQLLVKGNIVTNVRDHIREAISQGEEIVAKALEAQGMLRERLASLKAPKGDSLLHEMIEGKINEIENDIAKDRETLADFAKALDLIEKFSSSEQEADPDDGADGGGLIELMMAMGAMGGGRGPRRGRGF